MAESIRPYIVINGKSSREISGLLISSLPPISKPQMRVTAEEIDGRDGDIVTELGFSAYDKPVEIGLAGDYDINEVISYFNQAGVITFSNEPDKYYKFAQYNGIDFEKLIRFKTATVVFHVQPFKYDTESNDAVFWNPENISITNEGNIYSKPELAIQGSGNVGISLNGSEVLSLKLGETKQTIIIDTDKMNAYGTKSNVKELITDINPVQDLHGYDSVWVGGAGKNLLNCSDVTISSATYVINNVAVNLPAGNYVLSFDFSGTSGSASLRIDDSNGTAVATSGGTISNGKIIYNISLNQTGSAVKLYSVAIGTYKNFMIEKGSSATAYEPYSNICPISGFTEANITRCGVNLWDEEIENGNISTSTGKKVGGGIFKRSVNYNVCDETKPVYGYSKHGKQLVIYWYDKAYNYLGFDVIINTTKIPPTNAKYFLIRIDAENQPFVVGDISINYPSTDTTYHPYNGQTATVNFGQTVYGGVADVTNGKLTITHEYCVLNGTETITSNQQGGHTRFSCQKLVNLADENASNENFCSHFIPSTAPIGQNQIDNAIAVYRRGIYWRADQFTDETAMKNYLLAQYNANTPVMYVAKLATPIEIQLTAEEIQTLIGTNVIYTDTGAISELIYTKDGADVTTSGNIVSFDVDASDLRDDILKNRLVTGNYDNLRLKAGTNQIGISGDVDVLVLSNFSRWL